jgi:hypothetical protein
LITPPRDHLLDSNVFIESYNSQVQPIPSMADRFPSLEDFSEGMLNPPYLLSLHRS